MNLIYTEIEMATDTNSNVLFNPTQQVLRGRWSPAAISLRGMTSAQGMNQMPELPGMIVGFDPEAKKLIVRDPLADAENRAIVEDANRVLLGVFSVQSRPADRVERELTDDEFKTLVYWMRRAVDGEQARMVVGNLPDEKEIREQIRGRIRKSFWDTGAEIDAVWTEDEYAGDPTPVVSAKTRRTEKIES